MEESIRITFEGNGLRLIDFPVEKLFDLITKYLKIVVEMAKTDIPKSKLTIKDFSFASLEDGSADSQIFCKVPGIHEYSRKLNRDIVKGTFMDRSKKAFKLLNEFQGSLELNGLPLAANLSDETGERIIITKDKTEIVNFFFLEEIEIYGKLISIGGKTPNFHLVDHRNVEYIIGNISESIAVQLANRLYSTVGVMAETKVYLPDYVYDTHCKFVELLPYSEERWEEGIAELQKEMSDYLTDPRKIDEILNEIRGNLDGK